MKHVHFDMTFQALSKRADETAILDSVTDYTGNGDLREVTVFLTHEQIGWGDGWQTVGKEVVGVALADVDDPFAAIEILDRDQAAAMFGWAWVQGQECME